MNKLKSIWRYRKVRRTTILMVGCAAFLAGLGLTQVGLRLDGWHWISLAGLLLLGCVRKRPWALVAAMTAGLILGLWRGSAQLHELALYAPFIGQKVEITGVVTDDSTYGDKRQHDFKLNHVVLSGRSPPGQVRVTSFASVGPRRGDVVTARGKLYEGFGNYQAALYFADISIVPVSPGPLETLKRYFAAAVYNGIPEPQASLGLGFLLGVKSQLPDTLDDQLKTLALTHIVVASGYNLTILVRLSRRLFARWSKFQAAVASFGLMIGFVAITGFSPSMSRAALVTGLGVLAWYYGRRVHPVLLLLLAAAITAGINPLYLWSDLGWWLSFLAFAGVLIVAPLLQARLFGQREPKLLGQVIIETIAAQLLTLPLVLMVFGTLPLLALLANVLVVPLIPLAMALTFVAGLGGFVGIIGAYIAMPATWLLTYITQIVQVLAGMPGASLPFTIGWPVMVGGYGFMAVLCVVLWRRARYNFSTHRSVIE